MRWLEQRPTIGIDPDVCILEPPPPNANDLSSLCLWKRGHVAPSLCFEIVSASHPYKDYAAIQDRYAALGTRELCVFDPLLAGPVALGGPVALQMWRRDAVGLFERVKFGDEPAYSAVLKAWLHPLGRTLEIADDPEGQHRWLSGEERERAAREALERRVTELEADANSGSRD